MRPAFCALGETLVDAVTVGLVFNDENAAVTDAADAADAARRNAQAKSAVMDRMLHR